MINTLYLKQSCTSWYIGERFDSNCNLHHNLVLGVTTTKISCLPRTLHVINCNATSGYSESDGSGTSIEWNVTPRWLWWRHSLMRGDSHVIPTALRRLPVRVTSWVICILHCHLTNRIYTPVLGVVKLLSLMSIALWLSCCRYKRTMNSLNKKCSI